MQRDLLEVNSSQRHLGENKFFAFFIVLVTGNFSRLSKNGSSLLHKIKTQLRKDSLNSHITRNSEIRSS